jgi:ABC-type phosphate transport system substrate-binding protein
MLVSFAVLIFAESYAMASDVVIVGNKNLSTETISKETLQRIFLGQQTDWEDGTKIKFAILKTDQNDDIFLREYLYYTSTRFVRHWRSQVFSGKGEMPPNLKSDEEMLKFIQDDKGAIGFVTAGTDTSAVKVLTVSN